MNFHELLHVDSTAALNFFYSGLKGQIAGKVAGDETIYAASVLANYARTSTNEALSLPPLAGLSEVFDQFVLGGQGFSDPELLEIAGAQILLLNGFFRDQMKRRHNVEWYDELGSSFYERTSRHSVDQKRRDLFRRMSRNFFVWTLLCSKLNKSLREKRYLLRLD